MERLFRSLKSEWIPATGSLTAQEAQRDISHYLIYRYNWIRPHQFNAGTCGGRRKTQPTVRDGLTITVTPCHTGLQPIMAAILPVGFSYRT